MITAIAKLFFLADRGDHMETRLKVYMEEQNGLSSTFSGAFYGRHNKLSLFICLFPLFLLRHIQDSLVTPWQPTTLFCQYTMQPVVHWSPCNDIAENVIDARFNLQVSLRMRLKLLG